MKKSLLVFGIGFMLLLGSCTSFSAIGLQSGVSPAASDWEVVGNFTERVWVNKFFGRSAGTNFLNITSGATEGAVLRAIQQNLASHGGTAVINIEIEHRNNPLQWFVNTLTLNIWAPSTVIVRGTVIRQN
ncbi:MAG: hypothetical protein FWG66_10800 [Spirochaetes bacterium]|nr:hypothetical protein [Spirochaetota bacterium]